MTKKTRSISLILAIILICSALFSSCGSGNEKTTTSSRSPEQTESAAKTEVKTEAKTEAPTYIETDTIIETEPPTPTETEPPAETETSTPTISHLDAPIVSVNDEGLASWEPVEGAAYYYVHFLDENGEFNNGYFQQVETEFLMIHNSFICVQAVTEDLNIQSEMSNTVHFFHPAYRVLETPSVTVDENGLVTWTAIDGAYAYRVEYYNTDGEYIVNQAEITETSVQLKHSEKIVVTALNNVGLNSNPSEMVGYSIEGSFEFDLIAELAKVKNEAQVVDGVTIYTVTLPNGKSARFGAENAEINADGQLVFSKGGKVYSLDSLGYIANISEPQYTPGTFKKIGYNFAQTESVEKYEDLDFLNGWGNRYDPTALAYRASFLSFELFSGDSATASTLMVYCVPGTPVGVGKIELDENNFPTYYVGTPTNYDKLEWRPEDRVYDFYINLIPDAPAFKDDNYPKDYKINGTYHYEVGDLKDKNGNSVPFGTPLEEGFTLEITIGTYTADVPLLIAKAPDDKAENAYEKNPALNIDAVGEINVIVIPLGWSDLPERSCDKSLEAIRNSLGRVIDENGNVTVHSFGTAGEFSLSEYYDISSYGKLNITSFVTDWYETGLNFADVRNTPPSTDMYTEITAWLNENYDLDPAKYDRDGNGVYDAVIFVNSGDLEGYSSYTRLSFSGAYCGYNTIYEGPEDKSKPFIYQIISMNLGGLHENDLISSGIPNTNTLIHEFGHYLGLVDYYNAVWGTYVSPLGGFDMHDRNFGDLNPYSKYSLGWITPELVTEESFGTSSSLTFKIGSFTKTGDCIVIPARGYDANGTPFDEYIMIELFTDEGLNEYDAAEDCLTDFAGIRILHVDARQVEGEELIRNEKITVSKDFLTNNCTSINEDFGFYLIEMIQAGGKNTLAGDPYDYTNVGKASRDDFFSAGDIFSLEEYSEFFYNGLMDNSMEFGYEITIDSIEQIDGNYTATVTITKK